MKRDMDLVRTILLAIEERPNDSRMQPLQIENAEPAIVFGHVELLHEAGLIQGRDVTPQGTPFRKIVPLRLTWAGHEFLDAVRRDAVWQKVKAQGNDLPFTVIKELAVVELRTSLGLS